jgi:hypothetical protein
MRRGRITPTVVRVGVLCEDMNALVAKVAQTLADGPRLIWADDRGTVFSSDADASKKIPASWIAGTFNMGQPIGRIEEDLGAIIAERSNGAMLD